MTYELNNFPKTEDRSLTWLVRLKHGICFEVVLEEMEREAGDSEGRPFAKFALCYRQTSC